MLRFHRLAWHKNNLIIDDFGVVRCIAQNFLHHKQFLGSLGILESLESLENLGKLGKLGKTGI